MTELSIKINGEDVTADVEPRLSLADFIRDHRRLTGTHLGCEHGVCGACTVLMNGEPVRSCITFAAVADATEITTIEGFDEDEPMTQLRQAFHENMRCNALCTPGMLVAARDIVTRLPDADEDRVRLELAGNLCRCTGYVDRESNPVGAGAAPSLIRGERIEGAVMPDGTTGQGSVHRSCARRTSAFSTVKAAMSPISPGPACSKRR